MSNQSLKRIVSRDEYFQGPKIKTLFFGREGNYDAVSETIFRITLISIFKEAT